MENIRFSELVDLDQVQRLVQASFKANRLPIGIVEIDSLQIVASSGYREICKSFHRAHPQSREICEKFDIETIRSVSDGQPRIARCKNGLWDIAVPICVDGQHLASFLTGQFICDDEPGPEFFMHQAERYGFDCEAYCAALAKVPRLSRAEADLIVEYHVSLVAVIADLAEKNLKARKNEIALIKRLESLTSPLGDTSDLTFENLLDVDEVQRIQDAFSAAAGVASIITDTEGHPITRPSGFCNLCAGIIRNTEKGLANCIHSDAVLGRKNPGGPIVQPCLSGGLWDGGTSICVGDRHIANWLVGQVLDENADMEKMLEYARQIGADETAFREALAGVTRMPRERFEKICHAVHLIARQLSALALKNVQQGREIARRKIAEEERKKLEIQIQHAQKLESLGVLAGGIAHDFNNLLMAILGHADLALMDLSPVAPARENLAEIEKASRRAAGLCQQMLAYSGKGKFVIQVIDLGEVVEEMRHMLEVSISKKVVLRFDFAPSLPPVEADITQLRQIIMNLVVNAAEAIGEKSGVVAVTTGAMQCDRGYLTGTWLDEQQPTGLYVYLEVTDTGSGMDKETLAKIFDPFFTTKFTGRGLGLAAVLGIVRGHHGAVKVYSEPGKGTTFKILFPASSRPVLTQKGEPALMVHWKSGGTVLLVDDEETIRALGKQMLERFGFDVLLAADGREAVAIYKNNPGAIRCVLLDLTMPHMDGEETFRELRRIDPSVRVVISSGYNEQEVAQRFLGKGLAGFIQKPYQISVLEKMLKSALEK